jgi:15-cis-phytoene synthase
MRSVQKMNKTATPAQILATHGTSYSLATKFFPRHLRKTTELFYAWVRIPDELVDNSGSDYGNADELAAWCRIARALARRADLSPADQAWLNQRPLYATILHQMQEVFDQYAVPLEYPEQFLWAMEQDLVVDRYKTYAELERYMFGSASFVGLVMIRFVGLVPGKTWQETDPAAIQMGNANQMTNFIRDVAEDFHQRGRIYLPITEMAEHGLTEDAFIACIKNGQATPEARAYIKAQVIRTRQLFAASRPALAYIHPSGRRAARLACALYEGILDCIEQADYNVFAGRVATTKKQKLVIILKNFFS